MGEGTSMGPCGLRVGCGLLFSGSVEDWEARGLGALGGLLGGFPCVMGGISTRVGTVPRCWRRLRFRALRSA